MGQEVQHRPAVGRPCGQVSLGLSGTREKTKKASFRGGRHNNRPQFLHTRLPFPMGRIASPGGHWGRLAAPCPAQQHLHDECSWSKRFGGPGREQQPRHSHCKLQHSSEATGGQAEARQALHLFWERLRDAVLIPRDVCSSWGALAQPKLPLWGGGTRQFVHTVLPSSSGKHLPTYKHKEPAAGLSKPELSVQGSWVRQHDSSLLTQLISPQDPSEPWGSESFPWCLGSCSGSRH